MQHKRPKPKSPRRERPFRPESRATLLDDEFDDYEIEGYVIGQPAVLEDESK